MAHSPLLNALTRRERQIMDVLYRRGRATAIAPHDIADFALTWSWLQAKGFCIAINVHFSTPNYYINHMNRIALFLCISTALALGSARLSSRLGLLMRRRVS